MIDPALLTVARSMLNRALVQTCDVERVGPGVDDDGLTVTMRDVVLTGVPCHVRLTDGSKAVVIGGGSLKVDATITMAWGTEVKAGDEIVSGGQSWRVLAVKTGPLDGVVVAQCAEVSA